jgi:hypothetical protein
MDSTVDNAGLGYPQAVAGASEVELYELYEYSTTLAQIKIASCFRNGMEPVFQVISPILYGLENP